MTNARVDRKGPSARTLAQQDSGGFNTTCYRVPKGMNFYKLSAGTHLFDIVPYRVVLGRGMKGGNTIAEKGDIWWQRTVFCYRQLGPDKKPYLCLAENFSEPDPVKEYVHRISNDPSIDEDYVKEFRAQKKGLYFVWDHKNKEKGIQLLEFSHANFGEKVNERINAASEEKGWDFFFHPDATGLTLEVSMKEVTKKFKFLEAVAIDFIPRKEGLPKAIVEHGYDLDSMLINPGYDNLKQILESGTYIPKTDGNSSKKQDIKEEDVPFSRGDSKEEVTGTKYKDEEKPAVKAPTTAQDAGLDQDDYVSYRGEKYQILNVSGDGTSLKILNVETDKVERAIGVDEVTKWKDVEAATANVSSAGADPDWDSGSDWDK